MDVTENPISALGDDRVQRKRFADGIALHTLATTLFPKSYRALARLGMHSARAETARRR